MMTHVKQVEQPKILILATEACAYPGADNVGQIHAEYPTNTYIIRVPAPVIFPESFYLRCFERGIAGIIVMSCGHECPYPGAYDALAARISRMHEQMGDRSSAVMCHPHSMFQSILERSPPDARKTWASCLGTETRSVSEIVLKGSSPLAWIPIAGIDLRICRASGGGAEV